MGADAWSVLAISLVVCVISQVWLARRHHKSFKHRHDRAMALALFCMSHDRQSRKTFYSLLKRYPLRY